MTNLYNPNGNDLDEKAKQEAIDAANSLLNFIYFMIGLVFFLFGVFKHNGYYLGIGIILMRLS